VALGWLPFIDLGKDPTLAYLLIDYPGRGLSAGMMRPEENYRNTEGALKALAQHWGQDQIDAELSLMGHSFGTGSALQFAVRHRVERIVLVAPFNTLRQATAQQSILLSILMPAQIDNRTLIRNLFAAEHPPLITIFHGFLDSTLPVSMGRELAALDPVRIVYLEFPEDDHTNILRRRWPLIFEAINGLPN
jgi:pimeloyl-ACP methyl ester carboxylesterase